MAPSSSKAADAVAPAPIRSEGRAAVYGLLGALIGGLATFAGAYWTGHQTQSLAQSSTERSAYVAFAAAAAQFEFNIYQLQFNTAGGDKKSFEQITTNLYAENPSLFSDYTLVRLSSDPTIENDVTSIVDTLFSVAIPSSQGSIDVSQINSVDKTYTKEITKFETDASAELAGR